MQRGVVLAAKVGVLRAPPLLLHLPGQVLHHLLGALQQRALARGDELPAGRQGGQEGWQQAGRCLQAPPCCASARQRGTPARSNKQQAASSKQRPPT
jgi:hypothetical protein